MCIRDRSLPSVFNSALLFFLMMYIFAVVGNCFFSDIKLQEYLNAHANFQNIITAFLTLFRISTYDGWNDIMHDAMRERSPSFYCIPNPSYDDIAANGGEAIGCGNRYYAIYFVLSIIIIPYTFLNIFVAIVVGSVIEIAQLSSSVLSDEHLNMFLAVWKRYDPKAEGFVEYSHVWNILYELPEPLGAVSIQMNDRYYSAMTQWMLQLRIYRSKNNGLHYVTFYDVLEGLVKKSLYKPQTVDKIYNNLSKEALIKGLQELWDQRTQLVMDIDLYMNRMEDLYYYYELRKRFEARSNYTPIKVNLPFLVWTILKISKQLKTKVKERMKKSGAAVKVSLGPEHNSRLTMSKDKDHDSDVGPDSMIANFMKRSVTKEVDELGVENFGEERVRHNVPKEPTKMKNKRELKERKHNVPVQFQTNSSRFRSSSKLNLFFSDRNKGLE
eukprot:TRINITY_DN636_c0_g1_i1.p1 TRINITY_DN636_c0_g1~~TRINITY_DN636_c0_g1_i1.p1  ORF type:complete len:441 (-),score=131.58 TRINITY_DN636_c0_g1_i1:149-1471(-)